MRTTVCYSAMDRSLSDLRQAAKKLSSIGSDVQSVCNRLSSFTGYNTSSITAMKKAVTSIKGSGSSITRLCDAGEQAMLEYYNCENSIAGSDVFAIKNRPVSSLKIGKIVNGKPHSAISNILNVSATSLPYITSGLWKGNQISPIDISRTTKADASAEWLGYEAEKGSVTGYIGKATAETQNELAYAGVNAYLGKAKADAKADVGIMKSETTKKYKDGKWETKEITTFVNAEASAGAAVSILAADAKAGVGSDMLGAEAKAEGSVGTAKADAKAKFSVGEKGVNAVVKGEAIVSAVEGKASGTINILGLEITLKASGYAGAVGVEGKAGIEDNKLVLDVGAAAGIGGSVGVEIGFNDEGWDNFVDFITFWD